MSIISPKSGQVREGSSGVRYQMSMVRKTCEKDRFWAKSEKEKELRRVEMMMMSEMLAEVIAEASLRLH